MPGIPLLALKTAVVEKCRSAVLCSMAMKTSQAACGHSRNGKLVVP